MIELEHIFVSLYGETRPNDLSAWAKLLKELAYWGQSLLIISNQAGLRGVLHCKNMVNKKKKFLVFSMNSKPHEVYLQLRKLRTDNLMFLSFRKKESD